MTSMPSGHPSGWGLNVVHIHPGNHNWTLVYDLEEVFDCMLGQEETSVNN